MRLACLLLLVTSTAYADPCSTPPKDATLRKLSLVRVSVTKGSPSVDRSLAFVR